MNKQLQQVKARKDWLKIYLESGYVTKMGLRNCKINVSPMDKKV